MRRYRITIMPTAREGLLEIGEYIALDNPTRAVSFVQELTTALRKTLSIFPFTGKVVEDLDFGEEIRVFHHGNYNSYYRIIEDEGLVEVLFIYNARRDIQALIDSL